MRPPPSLHSKFFSSLNQVKKRLESEEDTPPIPLPKPSDASTQQQQPSLGSPLYLFCNTESNNPPTTLPEDTEDATAQEFFSCSPQFPAPLPNKTSQVYTTVEDGKDDIEQLIELLGLSQIQEEEEEEAKAHFDGVGSDGFNSIIGIKGPKSQKEMERLDGWVNHFMSNTSDDGNQRMEPLRVVHLLLTKAAVISSYSASGENNFEFPSTVDDFLRHDPPMAKQNLSGP